MSTGGSDSTRGNRIKELLTTAWMREVEHRRERMPSSATTRDARGTTAAKIGRRTRDAFFITSTAIVALVSLTAISYRPSGVVADARDVASDAREERIAPAPVSLNAVPLTYAVKVVFDSGLALYFDGRTAAMLGCCSGRSSTSSVPGVVGAVKMARTD